MKNLNKYMAELFGTFVLVFVGTGAAITTGNALITALSFALVVIAMAYTIGAISGAQLNPAVSLGMVLNNRLTWKDFFFYVIFQIIGAFLATSALFLIFGSNANLAGNQVQSFAQDNLFLGLFVEIIVTAIFLFVILNVTAKEENAKVSGFVIALTLAALILVAFNLSSAGLNPARSLAPAILEGGKALTQVWVFIIGPLFGSIAGYGLFKLLKD